MALASVGGFVLPGIEMPGGLWGPGTQGAAGGEPWEVMCLSGGSPGVSWVCLSCYVLWLLMFSYACSSLCKQEGVWGVAEGRKADSKRCENVPLSTEDGLAEEREGLEREPRRRTQTGAGTGTVTFSTLPAQAPWAECDDGRGVTVPGSNPCPGKVFLRAVRLSWSLLRVCSG